jgi:hypothetical protein
MRKALDLILVRIEQIGLKSLNSSVKKIFVVNSVDVMISSPWFTSETKSLKIKYDQPHVISKSVIDKILENEEREFEARAVASKTEGVDSYVFVEQKIMRICLNGYPTPKPYGKSAQELELDVVLNLCSKEFFENVRETIQRRFQAHSFEFHTFSLAAFATIRDSYPESLDFIFVDISGEMTDIVVSKRGIITETISFPMGQNILLRNVEKSFIGSPHAALESLLKLLHEDKMSTIEKSRMHKVLVETETVWAERFNEAVTNFSEEMFLPKDLFLLQNGPYIKIFEGFLRAIKSGQFTVTTEPFVIVPVDNSSAHAHVAYEHGVHQDIAIGLEADFISRFAGHSA